MCKYVLQESVKLLTSEKGKDLPDQIMNSLQILSPSFKIRT